MPQSTRAAAEHACTAYAPGRVELLGNHTDYNQGVVLAAAIDRGLTVSGGQRDDRIISLISSSDGPFEIPLSELRPQTSDRWANYALGVVSELIAAGVRLRGFSAMIDGNLPAGYGLSSSAAFEVATAMFLLKLFPHDLAPLEIARVCQRAEHRFVGVKSGLLDQVTSIFGRENHVVFFDCRTEEVRRIPFPRDLALVISESGKKRELAAGKYNERREETNAAASALGLTALRDASSEQVAASESLNSTLRRRALHITGENERVFQALELLGVGDGEGFGRLMNESHESSRTNFENSSAELDLLVTIARLTPGVLGSRLTGGGFGGATVTLCRKSEAAQVAKRISSEYVKETGIHSQVFVCRVADGAR
jgi:galactokinase